MKKFVCISTVALLVATPVPVMAFWVQLFTYGPALVAAITYVGDKIVGEVIYTESCYVENTTLFYYGYYKNIQFWDKQYSKYNPATRTTSYWTWSLHADGIQRLDNNAPFPLEPSLQDKFCDLSTTDENGNIWKNTYRTFEVFKFAVENRVVSERGVFPHGGPFPTQVLWHVEPLFKDCFTSESVYPVTDYLDVKIPKNGGLYGLVGNLKNRKYPSYYFTRPTTL